MNTELLKKELSKIYDLSKKGTLEKVLYAKALYNMVDFLPEIVKNKKTDILQEHMNEKEIFLANAINNNSRFSKLFFWYDCCFWDVWKELDKSNMFHLSSFEIKENVILFKINIGLHFFKKDYETNESFLLRKDSWIKNNFKDNFEKNKFFDSDYNKNMLIGYIKNIVDFERYSFESINGYLSNISIYIKKDTILKITKDKKNENGFNLASVEKIEILSKEMFSAISYYESFLNGDINKLSTSIISSIYCNICEIIGFKNNYTYLYEKIVLKNKENNIKINKESQEIGNKYSTTEMISCIKDISLLLEKYTLSNYCMKVSDLKYNNRLRFSLEFSPYFTKYFCEEENIDIEKTSFIFDNYCFLKDDERYFVDTNNIEDIYNILKEDFLTEDIQFEIKTNDTMSPLIIKKVSLSITDVNSFYEKLEKHFIKKEASI